MVIGLLVRPTPSRAFLGFGDVVFDMPVLSQEVVQTIGQITQVSTAIQEALKIFGLDVVIYKVSQKMSQKLINKVLNKATGGASGDESKLFVENFGKYFEDITNQQIGVFTNSLQSSNNPFAQSIVAGISDQVGGFTSSGINSFSLTKALPEGVAWEDAARDISSAGSKGWDFYGQLALPQNTPLGSSMLAQDELAKKIQSAKQTAQAELTSSGFRPDKTKSSLNKLLQDSDQESFTNVNTDGDIKTPANTTEKQSEQSVTETFDRLRNADTFGKIIFNTITQMVTGLIQKGFTSLSADGGARQQTYGGPRDLNSVITANKSWSSAPRQVIDLRNELDLAIEKTRLEIKAIEQTIESVKKPVTDKSTFTKGNLVTTGTIFSIEACIPGPDTGFEQRFIDYVTKQTKDTQARSARDNEKGERNTAAYTKTIEQTNQAMIEAKTLINNPFLNIPGSFAMKSVLAEYYKNAKQFRGYIDTVIIKRQALTALQVILAEAQALGTAANNGEALILGENQWSKLSQAEKNALYTELTPEIINDFPEYLIEEYDVNNLVDPNNVTVGLKPLPANDPATPEDERDLEMKKRILDHQWNKWESLVSNENKQPLYSRFVALSRDISDSSSAQRAQLVAESTEQQYKDLLDTLDDCKAIRQYLTANPGATSNDTAFIETLKSSRIRLAYSGPSILNAAENDVDFPNLNRRLSDSPVEQSDFTPGTPEWNQEQIDNQNGDAVFQFNLWINLEIQSGNPNPNPADFYNYQNKRNNALQVPELPQNATTLLQQDIRGELFCRLPYETLTYWAPNKLTGEPIGCSNPGPRINANDYGTSLAKKRPEATWYHTNNAEILFSVMDN